MTINYVCKICKKIFKQKSHYTRHQQRKRPCIDYTNNIFNNSDKKIEENIILHKKTQNSTIFPQFSTKNNYITNVKKKDIEPVCNFCKKTFSRSYSLARHYYICKIKLELDANKRK